MIIIITLPENNMEPPQWENSRYSNYPFVGPMLVFSMYRVLYIPGGAAFLP